MGMFSKNRDSNNMTEEKKNEELKIKFISRLEPVVYARLGDNGVDVKAEELIHILERLVIEGGVFTYEMNPSIADYFLRTGQIESKKYNRELNKFAVASRQGLQNINIQSKNIVENIYNGFKCEYTCDKCGNVHSIDASHFKADITFSFPEGMTIDYFYRTIPTHVAEEPNQLLGSNELNAINKYKSLHRMNPMGEHLRFTTLKQGLISTVDRIYFESGVRESFVTVFGLPFKSFMNEFLPESVSDEKSNSEFAGRMLILENAEKEKTEQVSKIKGEINELRKEKHLLSIEQIDAESSNDIEKMGRITFEKIVPLDREISNNIKKLWTLLLKDYKCKE